VNYESRNWCEVNAKKSHYFLCNIIVAEISSYKLFARKHKVTCLLWRSVKKLGDNIKTNWKVGCEYMNRCEWPQTAHLWQIWWVLLLTSKNFIPNFVPKQGSQRPTAFKHTDAFRRILLRQKCKLLLAKLVQYWDIYICLQ
jgi:hypothetical protein